METLDSLPIALTNPEIMAYKPLIYKNTITIQNNESH